MKKAITGLSALPLALLLLTGCQTIGGFGAPKFAMRINCASTADYTDASGQLWMKDQPYAPGQWGYVDGETADRDQTDIKNTTDDALYLHERYGENGFSYRIPVTNGNYSVNLHFAETYDGITAAGDRVFAVKIEGQEVLTDFDPYQESGGLNTAIVKTVSTQVADGELTIEFSQKVQNPLINAIEVKAN